MCSRDNGQSTFSCNQLLYAVNHEMYKTELNLSHQVHFEIIAPFIQVLSKLKYYLLLIQIYNGIQIPVVATQLHKMFQNVEIALRTQKNINATLHHDFKLVPVTGDYYDIKVA